MNDFTENMDKVRSILKSIETPPIDIEEMLAEMSHGELMAGILERELSLPHRHSNAEDRKALRAYQRLTKAMKDEYPKGIYGSVEY